MTRMSVVATVTKFKLPRGRDSDSESRSGGDSSPSADGHRGRQPVSDFNLKPGPEC